MEGDTWRVRRTVEFHVDAPESLRIGLDQIQNRDDATVDSSYFRLRNSLLVFMPVRPQKLAEAGSPCCEAKVVKGIRPSTFIPRQTVARFYVAASLVTLAH